MAQQTVDVTKLPALTGAGNYQVWHEALQTYLRLQGLWRTVSGVHKQPVFPTPAPQEGEAEPAPATTGSSRTTRSASRPTGDTSDARLAAYEKAVDRYERQLSAWETEDEKAMGAICTALTQEIRHSVIKLGSAKEVWDELKRRFDVVSDVQSFEGLQTAISLRYDDCKDVNEYIMKMSGALDKFQRSLAENEKLGDGARIQFLLCNLGEQWSTFLTSYLNSRYVKGSTTWDQITQVLVQEEMRAQFNSGNANLTKASKGVELVDGVMVRRLRRCG
ncbi:hypothetical protein ASPACDRAFT_60690 [Aspergillus aculeatus ATCC 16872]|uniref:DUF4219 domain-containing protein n=1 Tax=Aspergillus aculeatus (strain ATCC 16872 / CBS 172.66 / WB 5094) TaxID=690307 RepID=A0A1L9WUN5_ASPA1|nr:uncharacterized protein ASPACDRAFT_60690 [Aspergillus aculeatus ATCC 16872]OJJ99871.1 hypothetical protein ASPACDRAFT_60690 [Aspergillus aculeatus ATCC 16872]